MQHDPVPARRSRAFIVLVALLQGGLLYLAQWGQAQGWWPFASLPGRVCWYTLVLAVPTMLTMSVIELRDRRLWQHVGLLLALLAPLAAWTGWSASGAPDVVESAVLGPFIQSVVVLLFVVLPWLQCRLASGRWRAAYPALFEHAWQNALTLALALLFTGICWAVLGLWGKLFELVQVTFFRDLFRGEAFVHLATGTMAGLGILIGRTQQRPVQVARQILFAIFKGLLPLLAFIALLFAISLPFTGLDSLWSTRSAATLLVAVIALLVLFVNAVYQDGEGPRPYPAWLRRVVEAGLLALPAYGLLALYAMWLRIDQYGWTGQRVLAALIVLVAALYAFGYALAVLRRHDAWLAPLRPVNMGMSLVLIALAALVNSPLLDVHRIGAGSTASRLAASAPELDEDDLRYLRFDAGRRGHAALQELAMLPAVAGDAQARARVERMLARTTRWGSSDHLNEVSPAPDLDTLRQQIVPVAGSADADASWWEAVLARKVSALTCLGRGADCLLLRRDFDGDGSDEVLLCSLGEGEFVSCILHARQDGRWQGAGQFSAWGEQTQAQLRAGEVELLQPRWPFVRIGDREPVHITPLSDSDFVVPPSSAQE
ncbi:DUF4153 domain-containing protein [Xanthomonas sp. XNM01]|uniref:DUF4153 domain-containing protein n=1 Tax=Xanthomonas sp. XNM01 TaxID=2769289 RepID=UPI00177E7FA9|nr:DUF4153 domain-containing protein [Xanthomonas sp. XNM01]MBD9367788.1 DUF4153 domain-containing protein [Xanthomonas sp. XNM01]